MKKTLVKFMLALSCATGIAAISSEAQAYYYRYYYGPHHGYRVYYRSYHPYYYNYHYRPVHYRYKHCGYWKHGVFYRTRCY